MTAFTDWHKSTYSGSGENCVEQGVSADTVGVRDTKLEASPVLAFQDSTWAAFVTSVVTNAL